MELIIIAVFIVAMAVIIFFSRKGGMHLLTAVPGEHILMDEADVTVTQEGGPENTVFLHCLVRLTDSRIIIAQKALAGSTYFLRAVITYRQTASGEDIRDKGFRMYHRFTVQPESIGFTPGEQGMEVRFSLPPTELGVVQVLKFCLVNGQEWRRLVLEQ